MSRKSVQRFCDNDMRKNRDLKRERESHKIANALRPDARQSETGLQQQTLKQT
jgi:hypothetical protein